MGKYTPAFSIWDLATLGIDLYVRNTLGVDCGLLTIGLCIDPNLLFLARFNPNFSYLSLEMPYIDPPKDGASLCYTCAMEFSNPPKMVLRCITVPPIVVLIHFFTHRETIASRRGSNVPLERGSRCDAPRRDVTAARFAHLVAERVMMALRCITVTRMEFSNPPRWRFAVLHVREWNLVTHPMLALRCITVTWMELSYPPKMALRCITRTQLQLITYTFSNLSGFSLALINLAVFPRFN